MLSQANLRSDPEDRSGDGDDVRTPAEVELVAAAFLAAAQTPGTDPELIATAIEAFERTGDPSGAAALAAIAVLARPALDADAAAALDRLHSAGVHSPVEDAVGTLWVEEARRLRFDGGEVLAARLARPATREFQTAVVIIEHQETGGAALSGRLSPPGPRRAFRDALRKMSDATEATGTSPLSPDDLTDALRVAIARSAEAGLTVSLDLGMTVPILALALTGDAAAFAPVVVDVTHRLPLDPEDDDEFEEASQELVEHLFETNEDDRVVEHSGGFVATTLLNYKWHWGDGRLGSWTTADLDGYLLDYFPRKVTCSERLVRETPRCVVAFLTMLDNHGALEGSSLEALDAYVKGATKEFRQAAGDRRRWDPAKSVLMAMREDGVDPEDPEAANAWIGAFNARVRRSEEKSSRWDDPGMRLQSANPRGGRAANAARAKQRKAQRAARRRNRR